jgi:hypothetical protein
LPIALGFTPTETKLPSNIIVLLIGIVEWVGAMVILPALPTPSVNASNSELLLRDSDCVNKLRLPAFPIPKVFTLILERLLREIDGELILRVPPLPCPVLLMKLLILLLLTDVTWKEQSVFEEERN